MNTATENNTIDQTEGAIVEVKPDNALVVLNPQKYAEELFAPYGAQLTQAKRRAAKASYDVATTEGKVALRAIIRSFVTIRTSSDKAKTEAKRPIDQAGKAILAVVAPIAAACKTEEDKYQQILDAQLSAEEAERQRKIEAERVRVENIENRIAAIRGLPIKYAQTDSATLAITVQELVEKRLDPAMYEEYLEDAVRALNTSIEELNQLHAAALEREAAARQAEENARELARLKAERERVAAEEQAARDAAAKVEREAAAARERQAAAEKAALEQQLADMRAQMAAMQASANTAPVAEPEPAAESIEIGENLSLPVSELTPAMVVAASKTPEVVEVSPAMSMRVAFAMLAHAAPSEQEIVDVLVEHYGEPRATVVGWLLNMDELLLKVAV